jgi:hypothetical protein
VATCVVRLNLNHCSILVHPVGCVVLAWRSRPNASCWSPERLVPHPSMVRVLASWSLAFSALWNGWVGGERRRSGFVYGVQYLA